MKQNTYTQSFAHEVITKEEKQNELNNIQFRHALVTEIELNNGKKTKIVTIFNSDEIFYEELNIGIETALQLSFQAKSMKSTLCSIINGILKEVSFFHKTEIASKHTYELFK